jgi:hypothetical protein
VKNLFTSRDLPEALQRRVDLAVAVAQERLLSTHVDHALQLIELVGQQVPFDTALDIYTRLLRLSDDEARVITTRALATLGERAADSPGWQEAPVEPEPVQQEERKPGRRSFLSNVRSRLRGRVNEDLRRWIELSAARTEVALLETHVENALNFVDLIGKELPFTDAVELYLDALEPRESIAEVSYFITLSRLSERHLPARPGSGDAGDARHLKVVEREAR